MIEKVLIAEDHESANISVQRTLEELNIKNVDYVYYCDDAMLRLEKAIASGQKYDLLITDLSFEEDHRAQRLSGGAALVAAARKAQPELKVIVFSAESKPAIIQSLYNDQHIDGFVRKARNDAKELRTAIQDIYRNERYMPRQIANLLRQQNSHQFTDYDVTVISLLAEGVQQKNIPAILEEQKIKPFGLSSVEKRLKAIRNVFDFQKNEQLVALCKDMGII